jgi:hypothetical protein
MVIRIAASLFVILGMGAFLVATETVARGGFAASPAATLRPAGARPIIQPGGALAGSRSAVVRSHAFRRSFLQRRFLRNRDFGFGWPLSDWGGSPSYQPPYDQTDDGAPSELATDVYPRLGYSPMGSIGYPPTGPAPIPHVIPYRPGCYSQTQKLPWRDGPERSITIVRC